jgi:hypothetical protein
MCILDKISRGQVITQFFTTGARQLDLNSAVNFELLYASAYLTTLIRQSITTAVIFS